MDQCVTFLIGLQWVCELGVLREVSSTGEVKAAVFLWHHIFFWDISPECGVIYIAVTLIKVRDTFNRDSDCSVVTYRV